MKLAPFILLLLSLPIYAGDDPAAVPSQQQEAAPVEWTSLAKDSARLLGVMHAFRWATEPGTRAGGFGYGSGYTRSIGNLHGWADGDPFYVNYVGHPMQGSVASRLFQLNDPRFRRTEFGRSREYWKARLRAAAFSWAFSEQFEIGPLSEASIGHIQKDFPQQGFVDHVVTPSVGLAWTIGEDFLDRYAVLPIESLTRNRWARLMARSGLNPARTFANVMSGKVPWYRASRAGVTDYVAPKEAPARRVEAGPPPGTPAPFEFAVAPGWRWFEGRPCLGGGAEAAYRLSSNWQVVLDVDGCKILSFPANFTGDALLYQTGTRWTPNSDGKWSPFVELLAGGMKITHEQLDPVEKAKAEPANPSHDPEVATQLHARYTRSEEANGLAISAGAGVDYKLNAALALRVARVEYLHSTLRNLGGYGYGSGLQWTTGMVLRLGSW